MQLHFTCKMLMDVSGKLAQSRQGTFKVDNSPALDFYYPMTKNFLKIRSGRTITLNWKCDWSLSKNLYILRQNAVPSVSVNSFYSAPDNAYTPRAFDQELDW